MSHHISYGSWSLQAVYAFLYLCLYMILYLYSFMCLHFCLMCTWCCIWGVCSCVTFFMAFWLQMQVAATRMGFFRCYEAPPTTPYHTTPTISYQWYATPTISYHTIPTIPTISYHTNDTKHTIPTMPHDIIPHQRYHTNEAPPPQLAIHTPPTCSSIYLSMQCVHKIQIYKCNNSMHVGGVYPGPQRCL